MKIIIKKINTILCYNNHNLVKALQVGCLFLLPVGFVILFLNFSLMYFTITILSTLLIAKIGHSIGQHRYFCHKSFNTSNLIEWILAFLSTIATTYSAIYYAGVHRFHHSNSDTGKDPHCPKHIGTVKAFLGFVDQNNVKDIPKNIIKDLIRNKPAIFFHNYYISTIFLFLLILIIINPLLLFFCYIIPVGYTQFVNGTQILFGHKWGYKNFDNSDNSTNNILWNIITLGEGLHNNHHKKPYEYDFAFTKQKYEWDFCAFIIKTFLQKNNIT
jgi:stearoyl-CoA desaturase (delta-9 desaturase)